MDHGIQHPEARLVAFEVAQEGHGKIGPAKTEQDGTKGKQLAVPS